MPLEDDVKAIQALIRGRPRYLDRDGRVHDMPGIDDRSRDYAAVTDIATRHDFADAMAYAMTSSRRNTVNADARPNFLPWSEALPTIDCPVCHQTIRDFDSARPRYRLPAGLIHIPERDCRLWKLAPCGHEVNDHLAGAIRAEVNARRNGFAGAAVPRYRASDAARTELEARLLRVLGGAGGFLFEDRMIEAAVIVDQLRDYGPRAFTLPEMAYCSPVVRSWLVDHQLYFDGAPPLPPLLPYLAPPRPARPPVGLGSGLTRPDHERLFDDAIIREAEDRLYQGIPPDRLRPPGEAMPSSDAVPASRLHERASFSTLAGSRLEDPASPLMPGVPVAFTEAGDVRPAMPGELALAILTRIHADGTCSVALLEGPTLVDANGRVWVANNVPSHSAGPVVGPVAAVLPAAENPYTAQANPPRRKIKRLNTEG